MFWLLTGEVGEAMMVVWLMEPTGMEVVMKSLTLHQLEKKVVSLLKKAAKKHGLAV